LQDAVLGYRNEYRVERIFHRLKSRVHIAPLFVKLNDPIEGLTYLLTLGVRVLTVMEFVLRRSLQNDHAKLSGLHPENKTKTTDTPTAERILKAFANVSLTIIQNATGEDILRRLTPLQKLRSLSDPLQSWQWELSAFEDETLLEFPPGHPVVESLTLYNEVRHQTQRDVMLLGAGLWARDLCAAPPVADLTGL
jgi:hypothetical protein